MPGKRNGRDKVRKKRPGRLKPAGQVTKPITCMFGLDVCRKANDNSITAAGTASNSRGIASLTRLSRDSSRRLTPPRALCVRSRLSRSCPAIRSKLSGEPRPGGSQRRFQRCDRPTGRFRSSRCSRKDHVAPSADGHAHMPALRHACMPGNEQRPFPCSGQAPGDARRHALTETYSATASPATGRSCINRLGKVETPSRINPCPLESVSGIVWYQKTSSG